jgi:hypothetical protein
MRRRSRNVWAILFVLFMVSALHSHVAYAGDAAKKPPSSGTTLGLCRCVSPFGEDEFARLLLQRCAASEEDCQKMPCDVPQVRTWEPNANDCSTRKGARPGAAPPDQYNPMTDFR